MRFVFDHLAIFSTANSASIVPGPSDSFSVKQGHFWGQELNSDLCSSGQNTGKVPYFLKRLLGRSCGGNRPLYSAGSIFTVLHKKTFP